MRLLTFSTPMVLPRSALILYRQILDSIEKNDYNNFTQRAYVPKYKKFLSLPQVLIPLYLFYVSTWGYFKSFTSFNWCCDNLG